MNKTLIAALALLAACKQSPSSLVWVNEGDFINTHSNYYWKNIPMTGFYMGRYEITQKEWMDVMGTNPSSFKGSNLPVESVSWYDCIAYCNKRSMKEGLTACYSIEGTLVTLNPRANGYRLPTEAEWEYAAGGGQLSRNYTYSGSNKVDDIAWYWQNSGDRYLTGNWFWNALVSNHNRTRPVGSRQSNELGLYDMSGNVREWCWDGNDSSRTWKGGGWMGADFCCQIAFHANHEANGKGADQGFRVCRGK